MKLIFDNYLKCDVFGLGSLIGGALNATATSVAAGLNYDAMIKTNESQEKIAKETNETQLQIAQETNAMQVAENDKAYERSTATSVMQQYMKAGLSEQQARMLAAGSQPSAQAAQMQLPNAPVMPQLQAPQMDIGAIGSAFGNLGEEAVNGFVNKDGGYIGLHTALPLMNKLNDTKLRNMLPDSVWYSWHNFDSFVNGDKPDNFSDEEWQNIKSLAESQEYKNVNQSLLAQLAFQVHCQRALHDVGGAEAKVKQLLTTSALNSAKIISEQYKNELQQIEEGKLLAEQEQIIAKTREITLNADLIEKYGSDKLESEINLNIQSAEERKYTAFRQKLMADYESQTLPALTKADLLRIANDMQEFAAKGEAYQNPEIMEKLVELQCNDVRYRSFYMQALASQGQFTSAAFNDDLNPGVSTISHMFALAKDLGLLDTFTKMSGYAARILTAK